MSNGPSLVLRGTIAGSILVALFGWFLAAHTKILPKTEVAYAAAIPTPVGQTGQAASLQETDSTCEISPSYPEKILRWCEIITHFASQNELPPNLVAAVILQESGGDASAYSASGAVGLMQVMSRDGLAAEFECANGPCFASRPTIEELLDPRYNVEYGTGMLARLIARLESLREALKAYGPMDTGYTYADKVLAIYQNYH
jgi:soluble lytic murein transglycosylase-like protein